MNNLQIIYEDDEPFGIRDSSGFLLFFPKIQRYWNQEGRRKQELKKQHDLANVLLKSLLVMESK